MFKTIFILIVSVSCMYIFVWLITPTQLKYKFVCTPVTDKAVDFSYKMTPQEIEDANNYNPNNPNECYILAQMHEDLGKSSRYKKEAKKFKREADIMRCKCQDEELAFEKMVE